MVLRPYQVEALDAVYEHLRTREDNPLIVLPTASGKTPLMATICRDAVEKWGGRVLILAHVKELLTQTAETLRRMAPDLDIGVYSAGLNSRDTGHSVIVAGIQSVYKRAGELDRFDLVLADECHMITMEGLGRYRQFLTDAKVVNPNVRVIGLTATPYRLKGGLIAKADHFLNHICYEAGVKELIVQGYLCPLKSKAGKAKANLSNLHLRAGEFIASEVDEAMGDGTLVHEACKEIVELTAERSSVLVFASSVKHGERITRTLERYDPGVDCEFVCGKTPGLQRESSLFRFRTGQIKYLVNVNVLTTGFDAPNIDCVVLLRPTNSPGLFYQMVGRGFRLHPEKEDCLVLDYGGNILRHGPVDDLQVTDEPGRGDGEAPARECPKCQALIHAGYTTCPECGYEFPPPERQDHDAKASNEGILTGQVTDTEYDVIGVCYYIHTKRGASEGHPQTMRVEYEISLGDWKNEWVCPEHTGFARNKFEAWWRARTDEPLPATAKEAVDLADAGALAEPSAITVRTVAGERFDQIVACELPTKPPSTTEGDLAEREPDYSWAGDNIPF